MPNGRVRVVASKDLDDAYLDYHSSREAELRDPFRLILPMWTHITMTAEMLKCVRVEADNYRDAMESLWEYWRNTEQAGIPAQKAIEE